MYDYDLLVLGSGPSGQKAAIAASKLGRRVAIVDRRDSFGPDHVLYVVDQRQADHLLGAIAQQALGAFVEQGDQAIAVGGDDAHLGGRAQHVVGAFLDRAALARHESSRDGARLVQLPWTPPARG